MAADELAYSSSHCQKFVERINAADANPPTDEVITALVQMALLVLILAAVVLATHALQISFDERQAQRARQKALESSRQRLRTLSDRNVPKSLTASTSTTSIATSVNPASPSVPPTPPHFPGKRPRTHSYSSCSNSLDGADGDQAPYLRTHSPRQDVVCDSSTPAVPTVSGGGGGTTSLLAVAGYLLQRRHTSAALTGCSATAGDGAGSSDHIRLRSLSSSLSCGPRSTKPEGGSLLVYKAGVDSLQDASQVWGSVPQETIISTRQVLAAFNYDYSALHRREISYVGGVGNWHGRSGFKA